MIDLLAAAALFTACAQASDAAPSVAILPERELKLVLVDGWPAGPMPWTLGVDAAEWRKLLASAAPFDGDPATVRPTSVPHVALHVVAAADAARASVALDIAFRVDGEERAIEGPPLHPDHPQASIAPDAAVALRLLRADPLHESLSFERVGDAALVEREAGAKEVRFRFPSQPEGKDGARRAWVAVVRSDDRVDVFPADLAPRGAAAVGGSSSPSWLTIPRYRLEDASVSAAAGLDAQALQMLVDAANDFPASQDPVALRAVALIRMKRSGAARELLAKFGEAGAGAASHSSSLARIGEWLASFRTASPLLRASRRARRCEVVGDPGLTSAEFANAARVLQLAASALERLHLVDAAQTYVVLLDRERAATAAQAGERAPAEATRDGWIDVTRLEFDSDATALARAFLRAHLRPAEPPHGVDALAAFVATLAGIPPGDASLVAAAEDARRILDGDGPSALARFVGGETPATAGRRDLPPSGSVRIESLGHACFRFTADDGTRFLVDPYSSRYWLQMRFPWIGADHVLSTHDHPDHHAFDEVLGAPKIVEYDKANASATAGPFEIERFCTKHDHRYGDLENDVLQIEVAGVVIVHLGDVQAPLEESVVANLVGHTDVLLAPIDDRGHILDGPALAAIIAQLEPRIVIPMHYCIRDVQGELPDLGGIDAWLATAPNPRRLGRASVDLSKRDLPQATETWVLEPKAWPEGRLEGIR